MIWKIARDGNGALQKRWKGCPLPCIQCPKIPPGADPDPANAIELTEVGKSIYHYELLLREDRTSLLPRDSITLRHAAIIRDVERRLEKQDDSAMMTHLFKAIMLTRGK